MIATYIFIFFLFFTYVLYILATRKSDARSARLQQRVNEALQNAVDVEDSMV